MPSSRKRWDAASTCLRITHTRRPRDRQVRPTRIRLPNRPRATATKAPAATAAGFPSHVSSRGASFKRRHRIHGPFALYGGRIDPGKGCEELIEYFSTYVAAEGDASLVLMGLKLMPLPEEPFINFAGMLSEQERLQALEAATVVVCPSPYESLSLIALEALAVGTPILCNARSDVLVDHCLRSNGGLFYRDRDEFVECMKLLVADERLRAAMGRSGRDYVRTELPMGRGAGEAGQDDCEGETVTV